MPRFPPPTPTLVGIEFHDSSGITVLLTARNLAIEQQGDIVLESVPATTARILRVIGLDRDFTIRSAASAIPQAHVHTLPPRTAVQWQPTPRRGNHRHPKWPGAAPTGRTGRQRTQLLCRTPGFLRSASRGRV
ncbi:STAS domain-containing protein [Streptomyces sp. R08]|uniref:STAS domain-containing protein n=1 Tax=Streptomyces sp. R08 TaxID=3238624 RepID=A0AB39MS94_9ACTN